jgi:acetyl esterase/lipase
MRINMSIISLILALFACLLLPASVQAQPKPTETNVPYGKHKQQVLDFYRAESDKPTPLLFFIHGGGWMNGDKANPDFVQACLDNKISVVSINYRHIPDAQAEGIVPPVKACLDDSARALQFTCSKAKVWNFDKARICGCGGSAGGFNTLWLAFHDDMADPKSADPIAHESTRLTCAMTFVPQTSLDPKQMRDWIANNQYGNHAFSFPSYQVFLDKREEILPFIKANSPYELVTADDPPVFLFYDSPLVMGQEWKDPPHSANFGGGLVEKMKKVGAPYEFYYQGANNGQFPNLLKFITDHLQQPEAK